MSKKGNLLSFQANSSIIPGMRQKKRAQPGLAVSPSISRDALCGPGHMTSETNQAASAFRPLYYATHWRRREAAWPE